MLGSYSAAVVTSSDELAAAHVAIGIGLAEAEHRRVAIGDLVGEVDPIQSLVNSDDPHGISDSFSYGVSLNKIAQPVDVTGNLFVMPSGTGTVADPDIFRNGRWQRLANGFREVGALLLLVAPADAPGLQDLINHTDGVVLVGRSSLDFTPYMNVLARVPEPAPSAPSRPAKQKMPLWRLVTYMIILTVLIGTGLYIRYLKLYNPAKGTAASKKIAAGVATLPAHSPADTLTIPPPANPGDSLSAAAYAVEIEAWNAREDATLKLQQHRNMLPAGTISPVPVGAGRDIYYKLIAGAFGSRRTAEALLQKLRQKQVVQDVPGTVVRTPYALLLDSALAGHTESLVQKYVGIGQYVYVLVQPDGILKLYAGAFERPEDSATLLITLRAAKLNPILVYRTGRSP
jgi:hypothetical protein